MSNTKFWGLTALALATFVAGVAGLHVYAMGRPIGESRCKVQTDLLFTSGRLVRVEECYLWSIRTRHVIREYGTGRVIRWDGN